ncbi:MAG TPA: tetratricopeptide repeat protein [Acidobacteriota bacterium]|nr:tetratricopeptide repeat protein [Acidobacteriota bacterium]
MLLILLLLMTPAASPPLPAPAAASDAEAAYRQAQQARREGDLEGAMEAFEKAVRAQPDSLRFASEYRMTVIEAEAFDRALAFFEELTAENPESAHAFLNYGYAYVDKIPAAGSITQVLLANNALKHFTRSVEIRPTWIGLYTRGSSYLFWPKIFNRAPLGVADLERAYAMQTEMAKQSYHSRVYVSLGDGYFKTDQPKKARQVWRQGLEEFPSDEALKQRVEASDEELAQLVDSGYDPNVRVSTDLRELWRQEQADKASAPNQEEDRP